MNEYRAYAPDELGSDGYPPIWHEHLKHEVRAHADHRCVRCGHPYYKGAGEWSRCDERCDHPGPLRIWIEYCDGWADQPREDISVRTYVPSHERVEARWRILTVHHLDGVKANCHWWNLAALCQRCHLTIQGKVQMARVWPWEHSEWFRPYVAAYYAHVYLGEDLTRAEAEARMDDLLALERAA